MQLQCQLLDSKAESFPELLHYFVPYMNFIPGKEVVL